MTRSRTIERYSAFSPHVRSRVVTALAPVGERPGGVDKACRDCGHHVCSCAHVWVDFHSTRVVRFERDPSFSATRYRAGEPLSVGDAVCLRVDGKAYLAGARLSSGADCAHGVNGLCAACVGEGRLSSIPARLAEEVVPDGWQRVIATTCAERYLPVGNHRVMVDHREDGSWEWAHRDAHGKVIGCWYKALSRAHAMCSSLGYHVTRIDSPTSVKPFLWRHPDGTFGGCWFESTELAALAALAFDSTQRARGM